MSNSRTAIATPYERRSGAIAQQDYNAMINRLNGNIRNRIMPSNTVTFKGSVSFVGPHRNARYGSLDWKDRLESYLYDAIQRFLLNTQGSKTAENFTVAPVGFTIKLKVDQASITPSLVVTVSE